MKRNLFILFLGFCFLVNAQSQWNVEKQITSQLRTKQLGAFYVTTIKKNNNGKKSETCIINGNDIDCDLISKCKNGNCDELENYLITNKILKNSESTNKQNQENTNKTEVVTENNLYLNATTNKRKIYQGEQILVTYKLYTRVELASSELVNSPALNGFWTQDIKVNSKFRREIINEVPYNVVTVKKALLTAQKSGDLIIDPMEIRTQVRVQNRRDPFASFGIYNQYATIEKTIHSEPLSITVEALPTPPNPTDFYGAVGNIKLNVQIDNKTVKANEAINFKLTLSGSGNLDLLEPFKIAFPPNFEVYDPKITDKTFSANTHTSGKKTFEYLLIPRFEGNYEIPAITYDYFNPTTKKYERIRTAKIPIKVLIGEEQENGINMIANKENVKLLNSDIRYIKTKSNLENKKTSFFRSTLFWILFFSPILLFLTLLIYFKIMVKNHSNSILKKSRKATKIAKKRLKNAKKHLNLNEKEQFFEDIEKSLWGYFADKFTVQIVQLSKASITHYFEKFNIKQQTQEDFISLLGDCEIARYASSKIEENQMERILNSAQEIIIEVEEQKK